MRQGAGTRVVLACAIVACALSGCPSGDCTRDDECPSGETCVTSYRGSGRCFALRDGDTGTDRADAACLPTDVPCNNLDHDCDERIDEWDENECYPTEAGLDDPTLGRGARCAPGAWACRDGEPQCIGAETPEDEACDGIDNDCDGHADEALDGEGRGDAPLRERCDDLGDCERWRVCRGGMWSECAGGDADGMPVGEVCNAIDDDCDGRLDESPRPGDPDVANPDRAGELANVGRDCVTRDAQGVPLPGACRRFGRIRCDHDTLQVECNTAAGEPSDERCVDPADLPDAGLYRPDGGVMEPGYDAGIPPTIDLADEDCDGVADETGLADSVGADPRDRIPAPIDPATGDALAMKAECTVGRGVCTGTGRIVCAGSGDEAICDATEDESRRRAEECTPLAPDAAPYTTDEDCDGQVDEPPTGGGMGGLATMNCGTDVGTCAAGIETCIAGAFSECSALEAEFEGVDWCDGLNNDCDCAPDANCGDADDDGLVDEGCSCFGPQGGDLLQLFPDDQGRSVARTAPADPTAPDRVDALHGACGGDGAPDYASTFTAPETGVWRFRARSMMQNLEEVDPVIYVTDDCQRAVEGAAGEDPDRGEACTDDDGAFGALADMLVDEAPISPRGASVATVIPAGDQRVVVVDGFAEEDEGAWQLDAQRIDRAECAGQARDKAFYLPGAGWRSGDATCGYRRFDKRGAEASLVSNGVGLCVHNDGAYRAIKLDTDGLTIRAGDGVEVRLQGRLLPRAVDESDWFSVPLDPGGSEFTIDLRRGPENVAGVRDPQSALPDVLDGFTDEAERQTCLAEWTQLIAYVACTQGRPTDLGPGCRRVEETGHLVCDAADATLCPGGVPIRRLSLLLSDAPCIDNEGLAIDGGSLILSVGVIRRATRRLSGCGACNADADGAESDKCATYDLTIDYRSAE